MTDYAKLARQLYEDGSTRFEQVQTVALIAIAEALQPREVTTKITISGTDYDPTSIRDGVQAVLDHDPRHRAQRELDELREVVKGADHTAAKYYKRMRDAEIRAEQAAVEASIVRDRLERVEKLAQGNGMWKGRRHVRINEVKDGYTVTQSYVLVDNLRAALAGGDDADPT